MIHTHNPLRDSCGNRSFHFRYPDFDFFSFYMIVIYALTMHSDLFPSINSHSDLSIPYVILSRYALFPFPLCFIYIICAYTHIHIYIYIYIYICVYIYICIRVIHIYIYIYIYINYMYIICCAMSLRYRYLSVCISSSKSYFSRYL